MRLMKYKRSGFSIDVKAGRKRRLKVQNSQ